MNAEEKSRYFQELTLNLQHEGLTVKPETEEGLLPVEMDGQRLCLALETGGVRYWKEDAVGDARSTALERVTAIARITSTYMRQMEAAPPLTASGLEGDYRLLAEFNNVVLAGHPTRYGAQFVTWERVQEGTALYQGDYYGPGAGTASYNAAKQDFAVRSGFVPRGALFTPEQLTEVHRSIQETLETHYPLTDERRKCLESAVEQIERGVPDLEQRVIHSVQKEWEEWKLAMNGFPDSGGMQFR